MSRDEEQIKKNVLDEIDKIKEVLKDEKNFKDIFKACSIIDDLIIIYERILFLCLRYIYSNLSGTISIIPDRITRQFSPSPFLWQQILL